MENKLITMENTFSNTTVLGSLTNDFIKNNRGLKSIKGIFMNSFMPNGYINSSEDYHNFIPDQLFKDNKKFQISRLKIIIFIKSIETIFYQI